MRRILAIATLIAILAIAVSGSPPIEAQADSHTFAETGHTVKGKFWDYWQKHGGLAQQGYPLSEEFQEVSDLNGQTYTVQYFERAVFEYHPENAAPNDVLLSQLGTFRMKDKYPNGVQGGGSGVPQATATAVSNGAPAFQLTQQESYTDGADFYHIIGVAKNVGGGTAQAGVEVAATLFDANNNVIATGSNIQDYPVNAGQSIGFDVIITNKVQPARTDIALKAGQVSSYLHPAQGLSVGNDTIQKNALSGYTVQGLAKNNGSKPAKFVQVQVTGYDEGGKIVVVGSSYANSGDDIAAGATGTFSIYLLRQNVTVAKYDLFVSGRE